MSYPFLSRLLPCAMAVAVIATPLTAFSSNFDVQKMADASEQLILESNHLIEGIEPLKPSDELLKLAEEIVRPSEKKALASLSGTAKLMGQDTVDDSSDHGFKMEGEWVDIFVSRSLGQSALKQLIASLENYPLPIRFIFRGVPEGKKINDAFTDYADLTDGLENPPGASLDPTLFQEFNVQTVPYMVYMKDDKYVASVEGVTSPDWLIEKAKHGETGHLGVRGQVQDISEPDLIAVLMKKAEGLDLEERKKATVDTYWQRAEFLTMLPAREDIEKEIDPSFVLHDGIKDGNGKMLIPEGTIVNPLKLRPFTLRLIVFDPTRKAEIEWVKSLKPAEGRSDMYIATKMDRDAGWDGFNAIEDELGEPVYMLQVDVKSRFHLKRTPSIVTSKELVFVVNEFDIQDSTSTPEKTKD